MQTKTCSKCKKELPVTEYFKSGKYPSGKDKIRGDCKSCAAKDTANWRIKNRSEYNNYAAMWRSKNPGRQHKNEIKRRYGLSITQYEQMLLEQNYRCKICQKQHKPEINRGRLYVDHNHATGSVRGLLCGKCNVVLGNLDDRVDLLQKAIEYLNSREG